VEWKLNQSEWYQNWKMLKILRMEGRARCRLVRRPSFPVRPTSQHQFTAVGGFKQHPNSTKEL
jgi:hypothetical protein